MQKLLKLIMRRNSAKLQQSDGITHWVAMGLKSSKEIVPYMTASIDSKATEINYVPKFRQTATQRVRTWQCCAAAFRLIQLHAVLPSTKANPITWHENNSLAFWCVGLEKQSTQHTQQHTHHLWHIAWAIAPISRQHENRHVTVVAVCYCKPKWPFWCVVS